MMTCPVCGKLMPKKRYELGYHYCVDCSTEGRKVCAIRGTTEGDGAQFDTIIMTPEQGRAFQKALRSETLTRVEHDDVLNIQTFEQQDMSDIEEVETKRRSARIEEEGDDFVDTTVVDEEFSEIGEEEEDNG